MLNQVRIEYWPTPRNNRQVHDHSSGFQGTKAADMVVTLLYGRVSDFLILHKINFSCLCYETGRPASILIRETSTSLPLESRTWREEQGILVKLSHVAILAYRQIYGTQELDNHTVFEFGKLEKLRQASGLLRRWEDDFKPFEARLADNAATKLLLSKQMVKM